MQHYLQPDLLQAANVEHFDAWAATFGRTVSTLELSPDGNSYRIKARFASFANVPELLAMFRAVADVKTADQLDLAAPALAGGRHQTVVVPASANLRIYTKSLADRAANLGRGVEAARIDNMLKITGDGRKAALDLRLVGLPPDPAGGKTAVAAERIAAIYHQTKDRPYPAAGSRPGALQLAFCDLSTPGPGWNAYQELKDRLVGHGVPAETVRFVHEGASDQQKADLFSKARSGSIAVLIGSTAKMGVGTNVQARAIALHHLDAPWRPADMDQRDGRILRQGNLNAEVTIFRYVTEGSFDTFMYQTLERKSRFIHQVCGGDTDIARNVDDIGEATLSLAEVKALSTGNPLIMEKAGVDSDVARLERLAASRHAEQRRATKVIADGGERLVHLQGRLTLIEDAVARRTPIAGDDFSATIDAHHFTKRVDAAAALQAALSAARHRIGQTIPLGAMAGLDVAVRVEGVGGDAVLEIGITGVPVNPVRVQARDLRHVHPGGLLTRVAHMIGGLESTADVLRDEIARTQADITTAESIVGQPFDQDQSLRGLKARQASIDQALLDVGDDDSASGAEPVRYPGPDATPQEWEAFLAQFSPDPFGAASVRPEAPLVAMTTDELDQYLTAGRAALTTKQRARDHAHQAEERLRHHLRAAPSGDPGDPRLAAQARQQADRRRLLADIATLTEQVHAAQTELDRRAVLPHQSPNAPTPGVPRTPRQPAPGGDHPQPAVPTVPTVSRQL
jgi:hypothetical protein